jgi:hypothetical protein
MSGAKIARPRITGPTLKVWSRLSAPRATDLGSERTYLSLQCRDAVEE